MSIPDFTLLCACDASHVEELRLSYATWAKHKPSLLRRPLLILCDLFSAPVDPCGNWYREQLGPEIMANPGGVVLKFPHWGQDWPVRERMVAAFVYGTKWVQTDWYLKVDADLIATGNDNWIRPEWFDGRPAIIASPWPYTKPAQQLVDFAVWSDHRPQAFPLPMPTAHLKADGVRAYHRRVISYCQFGRTDWTFDMAELTEAEERLPIPSQDGFLSLCAARSGAIVRYVQMKNYGWRHVGSSINRLRAAAAEAMGATVQ